MTRSVPPTAVWVIRAFEGPRHARLETLWDCIAEFWRDHMVLRIFPNLPCRLRHAQCLNQIWRQEQHEFDSEVVVLTEFDVLPNLHTLEFLGELPEPYDEAPIVGPMYATRRPGDLQLTQFNDLMGAWWVVLRKSRVPPILDFEGRPDPCNQLFDNVDGAVLFSGIDALACEPPHFGIVYPVGEHLFWSRHIHDDPRSEVGGFKLGPIQAAHDVAVARWYHQTPKAFQDIVKCRAPALHSELCSAFTGKRIISPTSLLRSLASRARVKPSSR